MVDGLMSAVLLSRAWLEDWICFFADSRAVTQSQTGLVIIAIMEAGFGAQKRVRQIDYVSIIQEKPLAFES